MRCFVSASSIQRSGPGPWRSASAVASVKRPGSALESSSGASGNETVPSGRILGEYGATIVAL